MASPNDEGYWDAATQYLDESVADPILDAIFGEEEEEAGVSGGGGAGSTYPVPQPQPQPPPGGGGGSITIPGIGPVSVSVTALQNPGIAISAAQAALAVAKLVAKTPAIQSAVKRVMGAIIRRPPTAPGGQAFTPYALECLYEELAPRFSKPLCQYLAGLDAPIGLSQREEQIFLCLVLADAFDALDVHPSQLK